MGSASVKKPVERNAPHSQPTAKNAQKNPRKIRRNRSDPDRAAQRMLKTR
jgi:hypothetical protein